MTVGFIGAPSPDPAWLPALPVPAAMLAVAAPAYLVAANVLAYLCFGIDKWHALLGESRIPETTLLMLAILGGSLGAKVGQRRFRHKTRKQPFRTFLNLILLGQLGAVAALSCLAR